MIEKKVALIATEGFCLTKADYYFSLGQEHQLEDAAHLLYEALRSCDETDAHIILVPTFSKTRCRNGYNE